MSDKAKHTPGPWAWTDDSRVDTADGLYTVATANAEETYTCDPDLATAYANARLIAAAPELLEVLQECCRTLNTIAQRSGTNPSALISARAAIAQATGQEVSS